MVETDIARAVIDLNRDVSDRPPKNPDGIVKTKTCHGQKVYSPDSFPDDYLVVNLIQKYHTPYHKNIQELMD
ncbi:MAG: N-formylglutamate amidohydrolase, partial [Nitrospinales bacterium]